MRARHLASLFFLVLVAWARPAAAESGRLNLHVEAAFGGVLVGTASRDASTKSCGACGGVGSLGFDYEFVPHFALDVLVSGGAFAKPFPDDGSNAKFLAAAVGARVRFLDDTQGFLDDPGGRLHGNVYVTAHVGYAFFDQSQVNVDVGVGYEASLLRPVSLGPFLRVWGAPRGRNPGVDIAVLAGISLSIEALGPAGDRDRDGDGLSDGEERDWNTDPTRSDTDGDGIADGIEVDHGTDPHEADTDDDSLDDGEEDLNRDGLVDANETDPRRRDTDGGGLSDGDEVHVYETNPRDREDDDRDHDGVPDYADLCPESESGAVVDAGGCVAPDAPPP